MKQLILDNKNLRIKIEKIEPHLLKNDGEIKTIFAYLKIIGSGKQTQESDWIQISWKK